ncbi:hypothetical protein PMYN1_Chma54 (chromatophore) [Paulinella micropora]|uniref:Uncharacterized protein n=1 Tax=Paulinella micropora TaxID=1928728 RepID=A0A5K7W0T4_9EUKA|nr:hypothetical protein PMYN1_Chma54 [Paulinella micropora]
MFKQWLIFKQYIIQAVTKTNFLSLDAVYLEGCGSNSQADMAELVDALVSGTSGSNVVGVQISLSALRLLFISKYKLHP